MHVRSMWLEAFFNLVSVCARIVRALLFNYAVIPDRLPELLDSA